MLSWRLSRSDTHDWSYSLERSAARFWGEWNGPAWSQEWRDPVQAASGYRVETGPDGWPYTIKWWSLSHPTEGAGVLTATQFYVADGVHPPTVPTV